MTEGLSVVVVVGFRAGFFFFEGLVYKWGEVTVGCTWRKERWQQLYGDSPFSKEMLSSSMYIDHLFCMILKVIFEQLHKPCETFLGLKTTTCKKEPCSQGTPRFYLTAAGIFLHCYEINLGVPWEGG